MLVLGVRSGEYITIGQDIVIQVVKAGEVTRLAVQAPRELWGKSCVSASCTV